MKKALKQFASFILALALLLTLVPITGQTVYATIKSKPVELKAAATTTPAAIGTTSPGAINTDKNDNSTQLNSGKPVTLTEGAPLVPNATGKYLDVSADADYFAAVERLAETGVLNGVGEGKFAPNSMVNRAMLVTALFRVDGEPMGFEGTFKDVPENVWYTNSVAWAQSNNIVKGYSETAFVPMDTLTVEQIITVIYRYQQSKDKVEDVTINLADYAGSDEVSDWAKEAMAWGIEKGMIKLDDTNKINPKQTITRAALAVMVDSIIEYEK